MQIVEFKPREMESDKAEIVRGLKELLAHAEAGEMTGYIALAVIGSEYVIQWSAGVSIIDGVAYSAMLQDRAMRKMRGE